MNMKLTNIRNDEEKKAKRLQDLLYIPDIVRRTREKIEKRNAEGRQARIQATKSYEAPKWAATHNQPFNIYTKRSGSSASDRTIS